MATLFESIQLQNRISTRTRRRKTWYSHLSQTVTKQGWFYMTQSYESYVCYVLHDYAVLSHRLAMISSLFGCATSWCASSYMYLAHDLVCRPCDFAHVTQSGTWLLYCFMIGQQARRQWLIGVSWLVAHYDSLESWGCVTHRYESLGLGFVGGLGYIRQPPGAV